MCVHRSPENSTLTKIHGSLKNFERSSMKSQNRQNMYRILKTLLKEGGTVAVTWIMLSCFVECAKCSPLNDMRFAPIKTEGEPTETLKTGFMSGFISSISMIIVSELGDKTFFIAAVMAMKHARLVVFSGAMTALSLMTIFSALFGYVSTFIPRVYTYYISTALFAIFGFKMLYDGVLMSKDEGADELEEVQMTLRDKEEDENTPLTSSFHDESKKTTKIYVTVRRILSSCFSKVYIQALTMTFLAEWGDRSQLATVVLAARENIIAVCIGGVLGHSICTGLAVIGGRILAQRISVKTVTIIGGLVFLGFAIISLFMDPNN